MRGRAVEDVRFAALKDDGGAEGFPSQILVELLTVLGCHEETVYNFVFKGNSCKSAHDQRSETASAVIGIGDDAVKHGYVSHN
jgi:hypothetical protein